MFNLQGSELIIILLLALVVLGPEKLPDAMRKLGQFYAELKKMSSGFQQEFRSVVDEPMKEMRDTANLLRDSADFTKFQEGERDEKPKSADMAPVNPAAVPTDDLPFTDADAAAAPDDPDAPVVDSEPPRPQPFSGEQLSSAAPRPVAPTPIPAPPLPFASQAPLPSDDVTDAADGESPAGGDTDAGAGTTAGAETDTETADTETADTETAGAETAGGLGEPATADEADLTPTRSQLEEPVDVGGRSEELSSDEGSKHAEADVDVAEDRAG